MQGLFHKSLRFLELKTQIGGIFWAKSLLGTKIIEISQEKLFETFRLKFHSTPGSRSTRDPYPCPWVHTRRSPVTPSWRLPPAPSRSTPPAAPPALRARPQRCPRKPPAVAPAVPGCAGGRARLGACMHGPGRVRPPADPARSSLQVYECKGYLGPFITVIIDL